MVYGMVYNIAMEKEKLVKVLEKQLSEEYYTAKELQYSNKAGTFLSPFEYKQFIDFKESLASFDGEFVTSLTLKAFNYKCIYYCLGNDLKSAIETYYSLSKDVSSIQDRFSSSFIESRIYSEIEGSLNVENVPTTRRRLKELLEENAPAKSKNDIIIKNMKSAIDFVNDLPDFNKENLFKLYSILSKDCLDKDDKLKPGDYYRYDSVEIDRYHGCPHSEIDECMNSLFNYVNKMLKENKDSSLSAMLPQICHYYIIYIHPYFDYNGRTARMVSYWVYLLNGTHSFPPIISEAINQTKNKYYQAIENSRDSHNDLTYFLKYLFNIANDYVICYQNLEAIEKDLKGKGIILTDTEINYIKRTLVSYESPFTYTDFLKMINVTMSKQGALKILNKFVQYDLFIEKENKSKSKLFDINRKCFPYSFKNLGLRNERPNKITIEALNELEEMKKDKEKYPRHKTAKEALKK